MITRIRRHCTCSNKLTDTVDPEEQGSRGGKRTSKCWLSISPFSTPSVQYCGERETSHACASHHFTYISTQASLGDKSSHSGAQTLRRVSTQHTAYLRLPTPNVPQDGARGEIQRSSATSSKARHDLFGIKNETNALQSPRAS